MPHGEVPDFGQEAEAGIKGKPSLEPYWCFLGKMRQDRVNSSELASVNIVNGLWAIEVVSSHLTRHLSLT